ncbi:valine--tRNA ligase [Candidatus Saccharibacteria bacterium]|nr:valine--tRNA ligase [Candidatus Saccharibacteria bacterium]
MKLAKSYEPNNYEPDIYALWETSGAFKSRGTGEPYSVVMPPPNANGNLHLGHAFITGLQDILVRYHRMKGRDALYIPGADHAGFETWVVFEREMERQGKSRFDFTREQLYSQVWDFVASKRGIMELQLRALGASASWENLTFTLDEKVISTVYSTFQKMWNDGLIHRGERIVNFCTTHQTSFSDIEVEYSNEKGKLWKIAYPTLDKIGEIVIATTRPETLLGDTAIAVHPDDERYKHLIGTRVLLPILEREIPIIADEYVDAAYGTGALKVTPGHDPNDFEIGQRHNLEVLQVIGFDGRMVNVPSQFAGLTASEARVRILGALKAAELLRGESELEHSVGHCYKCKNVIEPLVKDQWFIRIKPLAKRAKQAIESGEVTFTPASRAKALAQYFDNVHDWNISRQIPWGIPIPAFQSIVNPDDWIYDERVEEKTIVVNGTTYKREEDTFDTWFSSGQWPFITTDYLNAGELKRFYPLSVMETGADILYQWVGRMLMLGLYATDQVPFKHVYLNGLVNDEHNQKMSKSKGNVINPMEVLSEYGSDALRIGVVSNRSAGQDQAFATSKVIAGRNFCNKLWNIARFIEDKIGDNHVIGELQPSSTADHWIIRQLNTAAQDIETHLQNYRFSEAIETMYHVIWDDVADWYVEASKINPNNEMLSWVLSTCLKLAHPFAPFVTETIWQSLNFTTGLLITESWPTANDYDDIAASAFERVQELVGEARYVIADLPSGRRYTLLYENDGLIDDNREVLRHLIKLEAVCYTDTPRGLRLANSNREAWIDIDADTLYEHQSNLEVRLAQTRTAAEKLKARLENKSYLEKAPTHLVKETQDELAATEATIERLVNELSVIS